MKRKSILIIIFIIALIVTFIIPTCVKADFSDLGLGNAEQYKGGQTGLGSMESKVENILGIIRTVGVVTSVVMLMAIGIKYMLGSIEEKAEYKKTMIPYLVGAVMVFAIPQLVQIIYNIVSESFANL